MKLLRNVGAGLKKIASQVGKGMHIAEKAVSAADQASGGMLRRGAATLTGGLSEQALGMYNANKGMVRKGLETAQKVGRVAERAGAGGVVGSGAWSLAKEHAGARGRDYMEQAEGLAAKNPKIYAGLTKPMRPKLM